MAMLLMQSLTETSFQITSNSHWKFDESDTHVEVELHLIRVEERRSLSRKVMNGRFD